MPRDDDDNPSVTHLFPSFSYPASFRHPPPASLINMFFIIILFFILLLLI